MFTPRNLSGEVRLVHPTKRTQKVAPTRPPPCGRVEVAFPNALAVFSPHPFVSARRYGDRLTCHLMVTWPFRGMRHRVRWGAAGEVPRHRFSRGGFDHAPSDWFTGAPHRAPKGHPILGRAARPFLVVGTAARGV